LIGPFSYAFSYVLCVMHKKMYQSKSSVSFFSWNKELWLIQFLMYISCVVRYTRIYCSSLKELRTIKGRGNRKQRIRPIKTYQKSCFVDTISDKLKFLFSVLCSLFLLLCGASNSIYPKRISIMHSIHILFQLNRAQCYTLCIPDFCAYVCIKMC